MPGPTTRTPIAHVQDAQGHVVTVKLTPKQAEALSRLTGNPISELKIGVEKLVDLGNIVAN